MMIPFVFYLYWPFLLGEGEDADTRLIGGEREWVGEHWWVYARSRLPKVAICDTWLGIIPGLIPRLY